MLEEHVEVSLVVNPELGAGVVVESVNHSESGCHQVVRQAERELRADGLGLGHVVVEEEEELAWAQDWLLLGVDGFRARLVSDAHEAVGGGLPVEACLELREEPSLRVVLKEVAPNRAGARLVGSLVFDFPGPSVCEELELELAVVQLSSESQVVGLCRGLSLDIRVDVELKSLNIGPFLTRTCNLENGLTDRMSFFPSSVTVPSCLTPHSWFQPAVFPLTLVSKAILDSWAAS